ncbi:MAG: holo-ACP synthase [Aquificaceae bacterium]
MIGVDIIYIPRIKKALERHGERFLKRVFSEEELRLCLVFKEPEKCLAGRWACKEAIFKAVYVSTGIKLNLKQIEVIKGKEGEPIVKIRKSITTRIKVSISHDGDYAIAVAYVLK